MRTVSGLISGILLSAFVVGCASSQKPDAANTASAAAANPQSSASNREPDSITFHHASFSIIGGIRILNLGHGEGMLTLLRDRNYAQPIRAKCVQGTERSVGPALQIDYTDDSGSRVLDLNHTSVAISPQASMAACLVLLDKLFETTTYYPGYINFTDEHKFKVGF